MRKNRWGKGPKHRSHRPERTTREAHALPTPLSHSRDVRKMLQGIGTPPAAPFKPDPFQLEALAMLEYEDVLVTAPTGSGKTWIARFIALFPDAIDLIVRALRAGLPVTEA